MTNLRFNVVEEAFKKKPLEVVTPMERPSEYFGKNVFNRAKMYKYLPPSVYETLIDVIDNGATLDRSIADAVAAGMKQWAEENGVTHYTHWFQPLTEGTAEKHDAFIEHDGKGGMASCSYSRNLTQARSQAAEYATRSRRAVTPHGTPRRPCSSWTTRSAYPPFLSLTLAKRWITKPHCCARCTQ